MDRQTAQTLAKWAKEESRKLTAAGEGMGTPLDQQLLEAWQGQRPELVQAMKEWGALNQLAHVLGDRIARETILLLKEGFPLGEARQQAWTDWAMLDPMESDLKALAEAITE